MRLGLGISLTSSRATPSAVVPVIDDMVATGHTMLDVGRWPTSAQAIDPHGYHDASRGKTVFGHLIEPGATYAVVQEYDHLTNTVSRPVLVGECEVDNDDHVHITLEKLSDNRIMAFYGSHSSGGNWAVTTNANDISEWTHLSTFVAQTYPRMINRPGTGGAGEVLFTYRAGDRDYKLRVIAYAALGTPAPSGSEITLMTTVGRVYAGGTAWHNGKLEVIFTLADEPDDYRRHGFYLNYDRGTGVYSNLDGSHTQLTEPDDTDANAHFKIIDAGTDKNTIPQFVRDTQGNLHVIWAQGSATGNWTVWHKFWDSSAWSTPESIGTVYEYNYDTGFADGPVITFVQGRLMAAWPSGSVVGFVRGGAQIIVAERIGGVWTDTVAAAAPAVGAFTSVNYIKNASLDFVFFSSERRASDASGFLQLWTTGTAVPDWSANGLGNHAIWDIQDLGTLWENAARTTPASLNGVVDCVDDTSGFGHHLLYVSGANKGVLRQDGSTYYIEFGADTFYDTAASDWISESGSTLIFSGRASSLATAVACMGANGPAGQSTRVNLLRATSTGGARMEGYYGNLAIGDNSDTWIISAGADFVASGVTAPNGVGGHTVEAFANGLSNGATAIPGAINIASRIMTVGRYRYDGSAKFSGRFYGGEAYARALTTDEREAREAVLAAMFS
jgi:hypothetical protein